MALSAMSTASIACGCVTGRRTASALQRKERLLAATDNGDVLVVEQGELRNTVKTRFSGTPIHSIINYTSGFIVAGPDGRMSVYEKNDTREKVSYMSVTCQLHVSCMSREEVCGYL